MWIPFPRNNPLVSAPLPILSDRQKREDLLFPPHRGPAPTHWECYHYSKKGQGPKVGKYSLTPSFASLFSPSSMPDSRRIPLFHVLQCWQRRKQISCFSSVLRLKTGLSFLTRLHIENPAFEYEAHSRMKDARHASPCTLRKPTQNQSSQCWVFGKIQVWEKVIFLPLLWGQHVTQRVFVLIKLVLWDCRGIIWDRAPTGQRES